jgi:hypothetical protein
MSIYPVRVFYPNGKIKFEYYRGPEGVRDVRCWEENGDQIDERQVKYLSDDSDNDLALRLKYICKKMPVPNFTRKPGHGAQMVVMGKDGPFYLGVDF